MKNALTAIVTLLLLALGAIAALAAAAPAATATAMTPDLAAKTTRVRTQMEQRPTQAQRQASADSLKALRLKLLKGQQTAPQPAATTPVTN